MTCSNDMGRDGASGSEDPGHIVFMTMLLGG